MKGPMLALVILALVGTSQPGGTSQSGGFRLQAEATRAGAQPQAASETTLWYRQAAAQWDHAMPLGNGRLGAMVFGNVNRERIQLNESSLWMGRRMERDNPDALKHLAEVRRLLFTGAPVEAYRLADKHLMGRPQRQSHAGDLHLLPALPKAWAEGSFTGLRGRGGVEVDAAWSRSRITTVTLRATTNGTQRIRVPQGQRVSRITSAGGEAPFTPAEGAADVALVAGRSYTLTFTGN